jgi:hypothetical protein
MYTFNRPTVNYSESTNTRRKQNQNKSTAGIGRKEEDETNYK